MRRIWKAAAPVALLAASAACTGNPPRPTVGKAAASAKGPRQPSAEECRKAEQLNAIGMRLPPRGIRIDKSQNVVLANLRTYVGASDFAAHFEVLRVRPGDQGRVADIWIPPGSWAGLARPSYLWSGGLFTSILMKNSLAGGFDTQPAEQAIFRPRVWYFGFLKLADNSKLYPLSNGDRGPFELGQLFGPSNVVQLPNSVVELGTYPYLSEIKKDPGSGFIVWDNPNTRNLTKTAGRGPVLDFVRQAATGLNAVQAIGRYASGTDFEDPSFTETRTFELPVIPGTKGCERTEAFAPELVAQGTRPVVLPPSFGGA